MEVFDARFVPVFTERPRQAARSRVFVCVYCIISRCVCLTCQPGFFGKVTQDLFSFIFSLPTFPRAVLLALFGFHREKSASSESRPHLMLLFFRRGEDPSSSVRPFFFYIYLLVVDLQRQVRCRGKGDDCLTLCSTPSPLAAAAQHTLGTAFFFFFLWRDLFFVFVA